MQWIAEVRNIFAELLAYDYVEIISYQSEFKKFNKTVQLIKLYLNFAGKIDHIILDNLDEMEKIVLTSDKVHLDRDSAGTFERTMTEIQKYVRIYLKLEWNRVKYESDPKNQGLNYNEEEELAKLIESYEKSENDIDNRPLRQAEEIYKKLHNNGGLVG